MRLRFWLRSGSAGLLKDKKRCRMCVDDWCVLCDSGRLGSFSLGVQGRQEVVVGDY